MKLHEYMVSTLQQEATNIKNELQNLYDQRNMTPCEAHRLVKLSVRLNEINVKLIRQVGF